MSVLLSGLLTVSSLSAALAADVEQVFRVRLANEADRTLAQDIGAGFNEQGRGQWRSLILAPSQAAALREAGVEVLAEGPRPPADAEGYFTPASMDAQLADLATRHPDLTSLVQLGWSEEDRPIMGLKISAAEAPAMGWRILGNHHGDELSSGELALATAIDLIDGYAADPAVSALLRRDAVWVAPMVNPDGVVQLSRYNARGVDLNRNYGYEWSSEAHRSGPEPFSERESRAIRTHGQWSALGAGLSMHSGETNLGWVWNHTRTRTGDEQLLRDMAQAYADACDVDDFWITNGADWYVTRGDTNDWSYGRQGVLDFTLETTRVKTPPYEQIPSVVSQHLPGVIAFLTWPHVIAGTVVDDETGHGVQSTIHWTDASSITGPDGRFGRPIAADTATVEVSAPGYATASIEVTTNTVDPIRLRALTLDDIRADPAVLRRRDVQFFRIDRAANDVALHRAGEPSVQATPDGDQWKIDPTSMSPGPWTIEADGVYSPHSLFIGEVDDRVQIASVSVAEDTLVVTGDGFGVGSEAWGIQGSGRPLLPLRVVAETADELQIDRASLPPEGGLLDIVVVSSGYQLAMVDVDGTLLTDTGTSGTIDSGTDTATDGLPTPLPTEGRVTACGCSGFPARPSLWYATGLLVFFRRRDT